MAHSAVAVIETPNSFIFEGPAAPRMYLYDGVRLFGGSIEPTDADARAAMVRELDEELLFRPDLSVVRHVWTGPFESQDRSGRRGFRDFSVFHVAVESVTQLSLQTPASGTIVEIPRAVIDQFSGRLTDIAAYGLGRTIADGYTNIRHAA